MAMPVSISVSEAPLIPEEAHRAFRQRAASAGAIVAFTGLVREYSDGARVNGLSLQHYPGFTENEILRIAERALARWDVSHLKIIHRIGDLGPGEPIVFVAAASAHRRAAFEAADFVMDYLKSEAPFWKKEKRAGVEVWIEPRDEDREDLQRWQEG